VVNYCIDLFVCEVSNVQYSYFSDLLSVCEVLNIQYSYWCK
jgi:hypothetical protein